MNIETVCVFAKDLGNITKVILCFTYLHFTKAHFFIRVKDSYPGIMSLYCNIPFFFLAAKPFMSP